MNRFKLSLIVLVLVFSQSAFAKDPIVTIEYSKVYPKVFDVTVEGENYTLRTEQSEYDWQAKKGQTNRVLEVTGKGISNQPRLIAIIESPSKKQKRELYATNNLSTVGNGERVDAIEILELLVFGVMPYTTPNGGGIDVHHCRGDLMAFLDSIGFGPSIADNDLDISISGENALYNVSDLFKNSAFYLPLSLFKAKHKVSISGEDDQHAKVDKLIEANPQGPFYLTINGVKTCMYHINGYRAYPWSGGGAYASFWMDDFKSEKFVQASKKRFPNLTVIDKRVKKADLDDRKASEPSKDATANLVAGAISSLAKVD